jgi:GTP-binding protein
MVRYRGDRSFVMADIPGIIEGAAEGKGLGHRFLRHIERNSTLLFMIACDSKDIAAEYKVLVNELGKYNPELLHKKRLLAITKSDMLDEIMMDQMRELLPKDVPSMFISAVANMNIDRLKDMIWEQINS